MNLKTDLLRTLRRIMKTAMLLTNMHRLILKYLNASLLAVCLILALLAAFFWLCRPSEIPETAPQVTYNTLPLGSFTFPSYEKMGEEIFSLNFQSPTLHLPDLKNILVYYGKNARPDAPDDKALLHLSIVGAKEAKAVVPKEKIYLAYNGKAEGTKYSFSPNNEPTSLWIECDPRHQEAQITLFMLDENQKRVLEPENYAHFNIAEKEFSRNMSQSWELGKWRVDATLLARQKARWYGQDRFLEEHGGEEYKNLMGGQRIDFGEGAEAYSLFIKLNDCLVYENDQWHVLKPGESSFSKPLLVVKRIDERLMNFELWDVKGKGKIVLNLLKTSENFVQTPFEGIFKFLGARTRSQFVFEINSERMLLRPHDWLILTSTGWKKLTTVEEIDDYVNRKMVGTLFIFDEILKKEDKQLLKGTVYNAHRTESYPVELAMQPSILPLKGTEKVVPHVDKNKNLETLSQRKAAIEPPSYAKQD